ncbi:MAG TPA: hypothetical protein DCS18_05915, partial [Alcanivorax sp.]|nr:hypothetical protein [Alcanivorax sp.]
FQESGERIAELGLKTDERTGTATVTVSARAKEHEGEGYRASETVHLPVRAANPPTVRDAGRLLAAGETWSQRHRAHGLPG